MADRMQGHVEADASGTTIGPHGAPTDPHAGLPRRTHRHRNSRFEPFICGDFRLSRAQVYGFVVGPPSSAIRSEPSRSCRISSIFRRFAGLLGGKRLRSLRDSSCWPAILAFCLVLETIAFACCTVSASFASTKRVISRLSPVSGIS